MRSHQDIGRFDKRSKQLVQSLIVKRAVLLLDDFLIRDGLVWVILIEVVLTNPVKFQRQTGFSDIFLPVE